MVFSGAKGFNWNEFNLFNFFTKRVHNSSKGSRTGLELRGRKTHNAFINIAAIFLAPTTPPTLNPSDVATPYIEKMIPTITQCKISPPLPSKKPPHVSLNSYRPESFRWKP